MHGDDGIIRKINSAYTDPNEDYDEPEDWIVDVLNGEKNLDDVTIPIGSFVLTALEM